MRIRAAALAFAVALVASATAGAAGAPLSPDQLALRLPDLGPGYEIALDDTCTPLQLRRNLGALHRGCQISFKRAWTTPGTTPGPSFVTSAAFVFDSPEAAHAALARPRAVAADVLGVLRNVLDVAGSAPGLGDEAVLLRFDDHDTDVLWRAGSVVGLMAPSSTDGGDAGDQAALRLAAAQQAHVATPTPLGPLDNDDREIWLDDPRLDVPVYWLGRALPAHGRLPRLALLATERSTGQDARRGLRTLLTYGSGGTGAVVRVLLSRPSALRRPSPRRELQRIAHDPCTRIERFAIDDGRAAVYSDAPHCKPRPDDAFALVIRHDVAVIVAPAGGGPIGRYTSPAGLRRLVRALRPR